MIKKEGIWKLNMIESEWKEGYPECTMFSLLEETAMQVPNNTALVFEGSRVSFGKLLEMINKVSKALKDCGVGKGDVVSIVSPNMPQAVYAFYGVNKLGAVANMIHPLLSVNEIKESVEKTKTKVIIILDQIFPKIAKMDWQRIDYPKIVLTRVIDALPLYAKPIYAVKSQKTKKIEHKQITVGWNDFIKAAEKNPLPETCGDENDTAAIMFSGGTTGNPKGVMLTNKNFNCMYGQLYDISGFSYTMDMGLKTLALVPIFHGFGLGLCIHGMLCYGVTSYLVPVFDFQKSIELIFKEKIHLIFGVPALFEVLARSKQIETQDLSFIKMLVGGGDKVPIELQNRVNKYMEKGGSSVRLREAYGQTECVCGCCISPFFKIKKGSVGIAYPDTDLKIVKPNTTEEVPLGEDGELCVCGPTVMKGYFENTYETQKALQVHSDGRTWLHTGDMFAMDEEGYVYFKQRLSRMVITSGYNIYLGQIEEKVNECCKAVELCCAVGVDDRAVGKRIDLHVELKSKAADKEECENTIRRVCLENFPLYSQPRKIVFTDSIPRTSMGKIDYGKLSAKGE